MIHGQFLGNLTGEWKVLYGVSIDQVTQGSLGEGRYDSGKL
jgi:hypothetical protein